jgi:hypothetical protein
VNLGLVDEPTLSNASLELAEVSQQALLVLFADGAIFLLSPVAAAEDVDHIAHDLALDAHARFLLREIVWGNLPDDLDEAACVLEIVEVFAALALP